MRSLFIVIILERPTQLLTSCALQRLFLCGFILGPVIFGPLSEVYGRKTIFSALSTSPLPFSIGAHTTSSSWHIHVHMLLCRHCDGREPPDDHDHALLRCVGFVPFSSLCCRVCLARLLNLSLFDSI